MTTGSSVDTEAGLQYLEIDLGPQPWLSTFSEQADALLVLSRHCDVVALAESGLSPQDLLLVQMTDGTISYATAARRLDMPIGAIGPARQRALRKARTAPARVVRTSLASPWVTVLASLAETSQPIAYGTGG